MRLKSAQLLAKSLPSHQQVRLIEALEQQGRSPGISLLDPATASALGVKSIQVHAGELFEVDQRGTIPADGAHVFPPTYVFGIHNAIVDQRSGLVFVNGHVIEESGSGYRSARDASFVTGAGIRMKSGRHPRESTSPISPLGRSDNFYHFLVETLPRVLAVRDLAPNTVFIAEDDLAPFASSILDSLEIDIIRKTNIDYVWTSAQTWITTPPELWWPSPFAISTLRSTFLSTDDDALTSGVIYVSRSQSSRSLANESKLEQMLASEGVKIVFPHNLSIVEQVKLFSSARVVIGPHGAGLTNMAFMQQGSTVIELQDRDYWFPCYYRLARVQGLRYFRLSSSATNSPSDLDELTRNILSHVPDEAKG